ncbi:ANTAR domain-containing protein [Microlunatus spumicola]|uniref:ANTAR domain-containing protein n=1 Tax=Microlunatus spumicola TaxID=81499 RepID=UPI001959E672
MLNELVHTAASVVPDTSCGITVQREGEATTVASSDDRARSIDETQYSMSEGPCLHSLHTGELVAMDDLDTETRWPGYVERARRQGLRSSLSLPLTLGAGPFGAMNLYSFAAPHSFTPERRRELELVAAQAAGALRLADQRLHDDEVRGHLEQALDSRGVIDQALGIIMAQQRCTSTVAFDLLRRQSQSTHRRLREVAIDLIVHVTGEAPQAGKRFEA